jgi:hypothetical protein
LQSVFGNRSKTFKHTSEIPEIFAPVKVNTKILMLDCDINILSQDGCQQDRLTLPRTKTNNNKKNKCYSSVYLREHSSSVGMWQEDCGAQRFKIALQRRD